MKTLIILTQAFHKEVEALHLHCHAKGSLYAALTNTCDIDTIALTCLLEHIAIVNHPVYGCSPKLTDMALALRHTEIHQTNMTALTRYLNENDILHLEGYATFRMSDYRHKLDMMMYCLIKKLKLTDSLLL